MPFRIVSPEMSQYMSTGRCPHCRQPILSLALLGLGGTTRLPAAGSGLTVFERLRLAPSSAPVTFTHPNTLTCHFCSKSWNVRVQAKLKVELPAAPRALTPDKFRFAGVTEGRPVEVVSRSERKVLRNDSTATVTDTEEFSWSVDRTVTVEDRKATIQGTDGRLTFAGLAALGRTLTTEVSSMYAVTTRTKLSRTKSVAAEVPPRSSIEIKLTWKVIRQPGVGVFSGTGGRRIEMPYEVDVDLQVEWVTRDL
ncbi:hypothetical protein [Streptomyces sp. NPDC002676]